LAGVRSQAFLFCSDVLQIFELVVASLPFFRRAAITAELNRNKSGEIGEHCLHFELFHAVRSIFDTRETAMRKSGAIDRAPFEVCCEVKEKVGDSRRRLDILIYNGNASLIEVKPNAHELLQAAEQAGDYSDYYDNVVPYVVAFDHLGVDDGHIRNAQDSISVPIYVVSYDPEFQNVRVRLIWKSVKTERTVNFGSATAPIDSPVETVGIRGKKRLRTPTTPIYPFNAPYNNA